MADPSAVPATQTPDNTQPSTAPPGQTQDNTQPNSASPVQVQGNPPTPDTQDNTQVERMAQTPTFRVNVVERTAQAVDYRDRGGTTKVLMRGTTLMPSVTGDAKVTGHTGRLAVNTSLRGLRPARSLGPQYLTYVLWAITPQGRPVNLGEIIPNDDGNVDSQLTTSLQAFGLVVTAEPYFAVTTPSDMVVAENQIPQNVKGWPMAITAKYELARPTQYTVGISPQQLPATTADSKKVPLQLLEARNAVAIADAEGAKQYAPDVLAKADEYLGRAEDYLVRKQGLTPIGTMARAATQAAEDARLVTIDKKQQEQTAAARKKLEDQTAQAQTEAEAARSRADLARLNAEQEADQRRRAEEEREAAQRAADQAEQARLVAEQQAQQAQQQLQASAQQQQQLAQQAEQARLQAQQVQQQAQQQRERLLQQLNQVLQTKDTARGLVSRMPDVLFDINKATLKPDAKIRLARVAGILLAYPDLKLEIDGYTDSTGTMARNEQLSQERSATVRDFLISQGVPVNNVVARGFGPANPIASNATASGRQQNRRVEVVVSGTAIGQNTSQPGGAVGSMSGTTAGTTGATMSGAGAGVSGNVGVGADGAGANVGANAGAGTAPAGTTTSTPVQSTPPGATTSTPTQAPPPTTPPPLR